MVVELGAAFVAGLIAGLVIAALVARRGRRLRIDWRLRIEHDGGTGLDS